MRRPTRRQAERAELGRRAEDAVASELASQGFDVIGRNVRVGRLELDIIAKRGRLIVFCEVRARRTGSLVAPHQSVDQAKVARIRAAAAGWLREAALEPHDVRLDVASVVMDGTAVEVLDYFEGAM